MMMMMMMMMMMLRMAIGDDGGDGDGSDDSDGSDGSEGVFRLGLRLARESRLELGLVSVFMLGLGSIRPVAITSLNLTLKPIPIPVHKLTCELFVLDPESLSSLNLSM